MPLPTPPWGVILVSVFDRLGFVPGGQVQVNGWGAGQSACWPDNRPWVQWRRGLPKRYHAAFQLQHPPCRVPHLNEPVMRIVRQKILRSHLRLLVARTVKVVRLNVMVGNNKASDNDPSLKIVTRIPRLLPFLTSDPLR